jgi:hypothetical protein
MARPIEDTGPPDWIGVRQAVDKFGMSSSALYRLALLGSIRYRAEPGCPLRFHRDDVAKYRHRAGGAS